MGFQTMGSSNVDAIFKYNLDANELSLKDTSEKI
jgi:hypothetical protein